jgi:NhaA family Na+:H+ antiporter
MYRISPFIRYFAFALLTGAIVATAWVNLAPESYFDLVEFRLFDLPLPAWATSYSPSITPLKMVSDLLMPLFFFFLGKELWEAMVLERGALTLSRDPLLPLGAFLGSAIGAVAVWLISVALFDSAGERGLLAGWATGIGSDVVFCYVVGRAVFGRAHPALHFLLLLTLTQDIVALCLATASLPFEGLHLLWGLMSPAAALAAWLLFGRHARRDATEVLHQRAAALWPYMLAGGLSWLAFALAGFPPELGLLPIIPAIPHALRSFGIFAEAEGLLHDPLNRLISLLIWPITTALFFFGLTRGAIELSAWGPGAVAVLATFWIGKPLGLLAGASLAITFGRGKLPEGMQLSDFAILALITSMGFVVPVTVLDLTLGGGIAASEARLGLAVSLALGLITVTAIWLFRRLRR